MSKNFVSGNILGGLGNQLFPLFTTISFSLDNDLDYKIVLTEDRRKSYFDTPLYKGILKNKCDQINSREYHEPFHHYLQIPKNLKDIKLCGYFQSWKYFHHNREKILEILDFKNLRSNTYEKYKDYLDNDIVLHFRLGDYKHLQKFHHVCKDNYYLKALSHFDKKSKVLYFFEEEDREIVTKRIKIYQEKFPEMSFQPIDTSIVDWEQMIIMTGIKNNIIANSTFSWWGAYLSDLEDKKIIYPSVWFGPALRRKRVDDLFFDSWIKI